MCLGEGWGLGLAVVWLVAREGVWGFWCFLGAFFNNILIIFSTEVEMYHLTDLLQNTFYSAFYLTEKLLQRPFIPCKHWFYQLHANCIFCLTMEES